MKKAFVLIGIVIIAVSAYFIYDHDRRQKKRNKESQIEFEKLVDQQKLMHDQTEWLKDALKFENEMRSLYRKMGYDQKRANDSVLSDQDSMYIQKYVPQEKKDWYLKEHRPQLVKWVD